MAKGEKSESPACHEHSGSEIVYYCPDHNTVGCIGCITEYHKQCSTVLIRDYCKEVNFDALKGEVINSLGSLQKQFHVSIRQNEEELLRLQDQVIDIKASIKNALIKLKDMAEKLEEVQKTAEDMVVKRTGTLSIHLETKRRAFYELENMLWFMRQTGIQLDMIAGFILIKQAEQQVAEMGKISKEVKQEREMEIVLEFDEAFQGYIKGRQFWDLRLQEVKSSLGSLDTCSERREDVFVLDKPIPDVEKQDQASEHLLILRERIKTQDMDGLRDYLGKNEDVKSEDIDEALKFSIQERQLEPSIILTKHISEEIIKREKGNAYKVYASYSEEKWKPVFVILEKKYGRGKYERYRCWDVYRRGYSVVSLEAAKVMNSVDVREHLLSVEEMSGLKSAIKECRRITQGTNATIISGCAFKSKREGKDLQRRTCVTIYCLLKGFIPFGNDPFPEFVDVYPTDIREGFCTFEMMSASTSTEAMDTSPTYHPESPRAIDYNRKLLMGTAIGVSNADNYGTLGGFLTNPEGDICFLTCAHVVGSNRGHMVEQPPEGLLLGACRRSSVCGEVHEAHFDGGSETEVGVDAALVKITAKTRIPETGAFVQVPSKQYKAAGPFYSRDTTFWNGDVLKLDDILHEQRNTAVLKFGASSGLTKGLLHIDGSDFEIISEELVNPITQEKTFFSNQIEVLSLKVKEDWSFFEGGDSGSLVFVDDKEHGLRCIGLAIAQTSYNSCIVTPIVNVLDKFGVNKFYKFSRPV